MKDFYLWKVKSTSSDEHYEAHSDVQILNLKCNWRVIYSHWIDNLSTKAEDDFKQTVMLWVGGNVKWPRRKFIFWKKLRFSWRLLSTLQSDVKESLPSLQRWEDTGNKCVSLCVRIVLGNPGACANWKAGRPPVNCLVEIFSKFFPGLHVWRPATTTNGLSEGNSPSVLIFVQFCLFGRPMGWNSLLGNNDSSKSVIRWNYWDRGQGGKLCFSSILPDEPLLWESMLLKK